MQNYLRNLKSQVTEQELIRRERQAEKVKNFKREKNKVGGVLKGCMNSAQI